MFVGSRGASDAPEGIWALPSASATLPTLEKVVKHAMWAIALLALTLPLTRVTPSHCGRGHAA